MNYTDTCDYDSDGSWAFIGEEFPRAKKPYRCCECRKEIGVGERHLVYKTVYDGSFYSERQCLPCRDFCMEIRLSLMGDRSCIQFGELRNWLSDWSGDLRQDLQKNRKKHSRLRSMFGRYLWVEERGSPWPFAVPHLPHRRSEYVPSQLLQKEWNEKRGLTL